MYDNAYTNLHVLSVNNYQILFYIHLKSSVSVRMRLILINKQTKKKKYLAVNLAFRYYSKNSTNAFKLKLHFLVNFDKGILKML